ncbi:recombinase family protein [Spongiactinospora rosea]|uniref:recombinase family protein n=1 Tax=Spongiactinospora rosea TaxID=2248750 RepID=UPI0018F74ABE|nr:recombinase family protein [Spongiactinospora rosea]
MRAIVFSSSESCRVQKMRVDPTPGQSASTPTVTCLRRQVFQDCRAKSCYRARPVRSSARPGQQYQHGRPEHEYGDGDRDKLHEDAEHDALAAVGVTRIFAEKISTRATTRPELDKAVALAHEFRTAGIAVTLVVHKHKRLGRGLDLAALAEQLRATGIGLEFLTGELQGSHDPSGVVFTVPAALSGMERKYIRDRTLEGHESARARGKTIGGATVTDENMLAMALHLRDQGVSLRDIAARLVITKAPRRDGTPPRPPSCACCVNTTEPPPCRRPWGRGTPLSPAAHHGSSRAASPCLVTSAANAVRSTVIRAAASVP